MLPLGRGEYETMSGKIFVHLTTSAVAVAQMQKSGYIPIAAFVLPENCWIENFYAPQVSAQDNFLKKYAGNKSAEDFVRNQRHEAELYDKYKEY